MRDSLAFVNETIQSACDSRRRHKAQGGAQRNPGCVRFIITQPAKRAADDAAVARFTGLETFCIATQGSAALHPRLYASACYRRLVECFRFAGVQYS
jgi:hypothetical protein